MFIPKKSGIFNVIALAVVATPLAFAAKSVNDYYNPTDTLVCQNGSREAHIYGNSVGWVSSQTLALFHKDGTGKRVYDGLATLKINGMHETAESKIAKARKIAQGYCNSGRFATMAHNL